MRTTKRSSPSSLKTKAMKAPKRCWRPILSDAVSPGMCMNETCNLTCEMEPHQDDVYCKECITDTMKAAPVVIGIFKRP